MPGTKTYRNHANFRTPRCAAEVRLGPNSIWNDTKSIRAISLPGSLPGVASTVIKPQVRLIWDYSLQNLLCILFIYMQLGKSKTQACRAFRRHDVVQLYCLACKAAAPTTGGRRRRWMVLWPAAAASAASDRMREHWNSALAGQAFSFWFYRGQPLHLWYSLGRWRRKVNCEYAWCAEF